MLLNDIGEGSNALFCLTNRTQCCTIAAGGRRRGGWFFPNSSSVALDNAVLDFDRVRGYSSVRLNRRNDVVGPTGVFKCRIPDPNDVVLYQHIGIYGDGNEGVLGTYCIYAGYRSFKYFMQLLTSLGTESSN